MSKSVEVPMNKTEVLEETEKDDDALEEVQRFLATHEYCIGDLSQQLLALDPHRPTVS